MHNYIALNEQKYSTIQPCITLMIHVGASVYHLHTYTGQTFASGSADKQVVLWSNDELKGILKYGHSDPIQSLQYNPVSQLLLSCTTSEVGECV